MAHYPAKSVSWQTIYPHRCHAIILDTHLCTHWPKGRETHAYVLVRSNLPCASRFLLSQSGLHLPFSLPHQRSPGCRSTLTSVTDCPRFSHKSAHTGPLASTSIPFSFSAREAAVADVCPAPAAPAGKLKSLNNEAYGSACRSYASPKIPGSSWGRGGG